MTEKPEPREIDSWHAAEMNAAAWMRCWGFPDAHLTAPGSDAGIDVRAAGALAQVKREAKPVGRPAVQNFVGARGRDGSLHLLFFSLWGYTRTAYEYAGDMQVALFQYDSLGSMTAVNSYARSIVERAREPLPTIEDPGPNVKVTPLWDPEDVQVFFYRTNLGDCARALFRMHRMGGEVGTRALLKHPTITIAPGWLKEYAGLVSLSAEKGYVGRHENGIVWIKWSSYSKATPETMERVTADAEAGMKRAIDIFEQLVGPPIDLTDEDLQPVGLADLKSLAKKWGVKVPVGTRKRSDLIDLLLVDD